MTPGYKAMTRGQDMAQDRQEDSPAVDGHQTGQMTQKGKTLVLRAYRPLKG